MVDSTVHPKLSTLNQDGFARYLEGYGDLVSRLIVRIARVSIWGLGIISPLTKSP